MAKTALVLGGTGQIGYATALALQADGWEVTAASRGQRPLPPDLDVEHRVVDRHDQGALAAAARGRDLLVDPLAFTPDDAHDLLRLDVGALAVVSSAAVYRGANGSYLDVATDETFPNYPVPIDEDWPTIEVDEPTYSPRKAAMERVLLAGDRPVSILRAGAVHGPYSPALREWFFVKRALDGRPFVWLAGDGAGRFHPAATANVAALVVACARTGGTHVLNAVDDDCPTEAEIGRTVFAAMGHPGEVRTFPGRPRDGVGGSPWGVAKPFVLSMQRARDEVGYRAPLTYAEGVERDVAWSTATLRAAEEHGGTWREAFPGLGATGAEEWFDYAAEDAFDPARG